MRIWRSLLFCMGLLVTLAIAASAQSNAALDTILGAKATSFGDAAYLVMSATKRIPETATPQEALTRLEQQGWGIKEVDPQRPITLGVYSLMVMKAFDLRGGIMYSLFHSPRYAARELTFLGLVRGDGSPSRTISGIEAVSILGSTLRYREGR